MMIVISVKDRRSQPGDHLDLDLDLTQTGLFLSQLLNRTFQISQRHLNIASGTYSGKCTCDVARHESMHLSAGLCRRLAEYAGYVLQ